MTYTIPKPIPILILPGAAAAALFNIIYFIIILFVRKGTYIYIGLYTHSGADSSMCELVQKIHQTTKTKDLQPLRVYVK